MAKTFTGTFTTTQVLSNPATVTSFGTITVDSTSFAGLDDASGVAWNVTNDETVESIGSRGIGIALLTGGTPCR